MADDRVTRRRSSPRDRRSSRERPARAWHLVRACPNTGDRPMAETKSAGEGFSGANAVNDFLAAQKSLASYVKFTIEELPDTKMVKVTPYVPFLGCVCQLALTLPKLVLIVIRPTGEYVACCGKRLQLAEITFAPEAKVDLGDVLGQLTSAAEMSSMSTSH